MAAMVAGALHDAMSPNHCETISTRDEYRTPLAAPRAETTP
jgi:hypothetical protein